MDVRIPLELLPAFQLQALHRLQDLLCSLLLSECIYKVVDYGPAAALAALTGYRDGFPAGTVDLSAAQFCRRRVAHRYMLGSGGGALYLAFMGTKELRDFMTDAAMVQQVLWEGSEAAAGAAAAAAAHGGFLSRAEGVPVESLYRHAQGQGLRLVLCGHSLGGAVAALVTLRLLSTLPHPPAPAALSCICFGTPALGNEALAAHVEERGWGRYFSRYALPEDPVPRLFLAPKRSAPGEGQEAQAGAASGGSARERSGWAAGTEGGGVASEAALAVLFREEAGGGNAAASAEPQADDAGNEGGDAAAGGRRPGPLALLSRWAPLWAHHALRAAARTAGAVRLPAVPYYPAFSHFGSPVYLSPEGVVAKAPTTAVGAAPGAAPSAADSAAFQRGWLSMHRMFSYRRRVLDICHRTLRQRGIECDTSGGNANRQPAVASTALAPALEVSEADGDLPVLWAPLLTPAPAAPAAASSSPMSSEPAGAQSAVFLQPLPAPRSSGERGSGRVWRFGRPGAPAAGAATARLPATYTLTVGVRGRGLDMCGGALLRLPGGTVVKAAAVTNLAKERAIAALTAAHQADLGARQGREERLPGAGRLLRAVRSGLPTFSAPPSDAAVPSAADLVLRFAAPTSALLQLTWQGALHRPDHASLVLLSAFAKAPAPVRLLPRTAWLLGPDPRLCQVAFGWLRASAAADAAMAAAGAAAAARPRWLPLGIAAGYGGRTAATAGAAAAASRGSLQQEGAANSSPGPGAAASWLARVPAGMRRLYAEHAVPWLRQAQRRVIGAVGGGAPAAGQDLPATLLRGVLVRDASSAVRGAGSGADCVARAAALLQWKTDQLAEGRGAVPEGSSRDEYFFGDVGYGFEDEEDRLAAVQPPGLGARVLQSIHQAGAGVRRRAALLLRWRSIRSAPPPRVVALVVSAAALESSKTDSGLDHKMLAAIQRTATAAAALGAATLLAVVSSRPLDAAYRRKLSYSAGLHGRPGAVVPVLWQGERDEAAAASLLQAAILAHAAVGGRQKLAPSGRL